MPWLSAIARNHAIDQLRARKAVANTIDEAYDLADSAPDPEKSAINKAEAARSTNVWLNLRQTAWMRCARPVSKG